MLFTVKKNVPTANSSLYEIVLSVQTIVVDM